MRLSTKGGVVMEWEHLIHIKINNAEKAVTYIPVIRKFDGASISAIKNRILTGYAVSFDFESQGKYDEYLDGEVSPHQAFRLLIDKLISLGADLTFYEQLNGEISPLPLEHIDNMIHRDEEINAQLDQEDERAFGGEEREDELDGGNAW